MTDTKNVILALKRVKDEKNLSLDKIMAIMEESGEFVSKTTLSRVFRENSENQSFNYDGTLRPIANALLDIETIETDDDTNTKAYKSILKLKKELISELEDKIKAVESEEKRKYYDKLAKETDKFQKSLEFAMHQIELKDKRIDQLMNDNHLLLNQMLSCHKKCSGGKAE